MQTSEILEDFSVPAVRHALEANVDAQLPLMYAHMPGMEVIDEADLLCMTSDLRALDAPSPPPSLAIERMRDEAQLEQWLRTVAIAFELHPDVVSALRGLLAGQGFGSDRP
jgi:hypothetical protein